MRRSEHKRGERQREKEKQAPHEAGLHHRTPESGKTACSVICMSVAGKARLFSEFPESGCRAHYEV